MTLESMLRNAKARDPEGFRRALAKLGLAADTAVTSRFGRALRERFKNRGGISGVLRALGMDAALLEGRGSSSVTDNKEWSKVPTERSHSVSRDNEMEEEEPMQFDESFREALRDKGLGEDDIETIMRMLSKHMMGDEMSDEEGEREYAEHGHAHGQQIAAAQS